MNGWKIFLHSLRMVLNNLGTALRVSLVLYLLPALAQILLFRSYEGAAAGTIPGVSGSSLIVLVISLLSSLWIAVGWHRYVLTGEEPRGWLPAWHPSEMISYFWRSLLIGLLVFAVMMVAMIVVMVLGSLARSLLGILAFGLVGLASYIFFRVALVLPAAALGRPMPLRTSWQATREDSASIVALALIVIGGSLLMELPALIDGDRGSVVNLVYGLVVNWFATIIGVSMLTTLYGHFIEDRPID